MAQDDLGLDVEESPEGLADLHHDKWLIPSGGNLKALAARIFVELEATTPRPSKVRQDATSRRLEMVENIVANFALLVAYRPHSSRLIVSASATRKSRYQRQGFALKAFMDVVGGLERLRWIDRQIGSRGGKRTTLGASNHFREQLHQLGKTPLLGRLNGAETIQLKASQGRRKLKKLVEYADTPETALMRSQMAAINDAINKSNITLDGISRPPTHLVRMFQIERPDAPPTFNLHGRLYHGFWQDLPREKRRLIQIDGQQVAEVDFSGMFVQLAYAGIDAPAPQGDVYDDTDMPRDAAKSALLVLLCRTGEMKRLPSELQKVLGSGWNGHRVTATMMSRHPAIASLFGTGMGLRLMYLDSCIMVSTLLKLIKDGTVALPIHDGLLIPIKYQDACIEIMQDASEEIVGRRLPVSVKR